MKFEGNVADNFKKFKQSLQIYLKASGKDKKNSDVKVATLLNVIGPEEVEVYNTFQLSEDQQNFEK